MLLNDGAAVMDGAASVHHGFRPVVRAAAMDNGTAVMDGAAFAHARALMGRRAAFVQGLHFVNGTVFAYARALPGRAGFMHGLGFMNRRAFLHGWSYLMTCTLPLHRSFHLMACALPLDRRFHLVAGRGPLCLRTDLPGLGRGFATAVRADCRCFGYAHYERGA